jgi:ABC-2 type transport system ATP-binding protein
VLANGRVQLEGAPLDLIAQAKGRVWKKTIDRDEVDAHQNQYQIISTRLFAGRTIIHILTDSAVAGFEPVNAGLEDVYFTTLADLRLADQRRAA